MASMAMLLNALVPVAQNANLDVQEIVDSFVTLAAWNCYSSSFLAMLKPGVFNYSLEPSPGDLLRLSLLCTRRMESSERPVNSCWVKVGTDAFQDVIQKIVIPKLSFARDRMTDKVDQSSLHAAISNTFLEQICSEYFYPLKQEERMLAFMQEYGTFIAFYHDQVDRLELALPCFALLHNCGLPLDSWGKISQHLSMTQELLQPHLPTMRLYCSQLNALVLEFPRANLSWAQKVFTIRETECMMHLHCLNKSSRKYQGLGQLEKAQKRAKVCVTDALYILEEAVEVSTPV